MQSTVVGFALIIVVMFVVVTIGYKIGVQRGRSTPNGLPILYSDLERNEWFVIDAITAEDAHRVVVLKKCLSSSYFQVTNDVPRLVYLPPEREQSIEVGDQVRYCCDGKVPPYVQIEKASKPRLAVER